MDEPHTISEPTDWQKMLDEVSGAFDSENEGVLCDMIRGIIRGYCATIPGDKMCSEGWYGFKGMFESMFHPEKIYADMCMIRDRKLGQYPPSQRWIDSCLSYVCFRKYARMLLTAWAMWHGYEDALWDVQDYTASGHSFLMREFYPIIERMMIAKQG